MREETAHYILEAVYEQVDIDRVDLEPHDLRSAGWQIDGEVDGEFVVITDFNSRRGEVEIGFYPSHEVWMAGSEPLFYRENLNLSGLIALLLAFLNGNLDRDPDAAREENQIRDRD